MEKDYGRCVAQWNAIFAAEEPIAPASPDTGVPGLTRALDWLCQGAAHVLDFGCGNGVMLCWCALRGVERVTGIDLSPEAVHQAQRRLSQLPHAASCLRLGGVDALGDVPDASAQGVLLCNILDNLYPDDCEDALVHCARILAPGGRALIQLNPYLSQEQIAAWGLRVIDGNLLDDGLLLNNLPDDAWHAAITRHLTVVGQEAIRYEAAGQAARLFRAVKPA